MAANTMISILFKNKFRWGGINEIKISLSIFRFFKRNERIFRVVGVK